LYNLAHNVDELGYRLTADRRLADLGYSTVGSVYAYTVVRSVTLDCICSVIDALTTAGIMLKISSISADRGISLQNRYVQRKQMSRWRGNVYGIGDIRVPYVSEA